MNRSDAAEMRTKILTNIFSTEPNKRTTKKYRVIILVMILFQSNQLCTNYV
jgi:hypothetical protein